MLTYLFQRYYLWTFLILSGLAGLALGNLGGTFFGVITEPETMQFKPADIDSQQPARQLTTENYQVIMRRNIFNATPADLPADPATSTAGKRSNSSKWTLVGTVSGGLTPLATLQDSSGTVTYALDEELPDDAVLSEIERNRVTLRYPGGRTVILEVEEAQQPIITPRRKVAPRRSSGGVIEELGSNRWRIPALVAENARDNIGIILKQAHAVPYLEGGQTTGFELQMLQRGSLLENIGLKKGDILRSINGQELNSPEKALQIFGQLRQAKNINIDLERRGKAITLAYEIR